MDIANLQLAARRLAIERAEKEYKIQCDVFDTADRKAQATTTIAGALLAADLGFVAKLSEKPSLLAQSALVAITIALGCSVLMALWAMYARDSELPASGAETESKYANVMKQSTVDAFGTAEAELLDFLIEELKQANGSVADVSGKKACWVHRAQIALIVAAISTIALTLALIFWPDLLALKPNSDASSEQAVVLATEAGVRKDLRIVLPSSASSASAASTEIPGSSPLAKVHRRD
ncbi:hypothetical protein [Burkholderia ubonensis]|uniref:hypothetical protein n=1 Tax=Burkholderia ubonensis TaxID=101571 RepID=UPI000B314559|nr:hypothetical protein [Burkholderia ubonensis]